MSKALKTAEKESEIPQKPASNEQNPAKKSEDFAEGPVASQESNNAPNVAIDSAQGDTAQPVTMGIATETDPYNEGSTGDASEFIGKRVLYYPGQRDMQLARNGEACFPGVIVQHSEEGANIVCSRMDYQSPIFTVFNVFGKHERQDTREIFGYWIELKN